MVNGIGAVFRGFRRSQFRVTFRPDDETVAGHRRKTGCVDILGARTSWEREHLGSANILGARTSWEREHPGSADILGARTSWEREHLGSADILGARTSWVRGHPGCADILGARASGPQLEASSPFLAPGGSLKGAKGRVWRWLETCLRRQSTQRSDASYADCMTRVSSRRLRPSCIIVAG